MRGAGGFTLRGPMIRSIQIEGFKSLRSFSLEPGRFTVLVGPNGAGKSSVLQALHLISRFARRPPPPYEGPVFSGWSRAQDEERETRNQNHLKTVFHEKWMPEWLVSRSKEQMSLQLQDENGTFCLQIKSANTPIKACLEIDQWSSERSSKKAKTDIATIWRSQAIKRFAGMVHLSLEVNKLIAPSSVSEEQPNLEPDGAGLASVLAYLAGAEPDTKAAIEKDLRQVVPQVRRILTKPAKISVLRKKPYPVGDQVIELPVEEEIWGQRFFLEMAGGGQVPAEQLSEGTVLALGLLTLLHSPGAPQLLLLDDLDRALHLGAQTRLVEIIRGLLERRPELQVICTSHSPFLLQDIEPHDVLVMAADEEGWSHSCRLDQHPDYQRFRAALTTGELWATLGEDWVLAGEKVSA